ncbi:cytochrome P450 86B1-like [Cryptomeria japonica]|uniref:cytochrome P450 86B1-like n=1 Tax=Cryptomeria japonica TaxID=3369 RepID=UPI0025AC92AC|nr:cytochrome P450 86B1-like [Cryptomeria japonica]
MGSNLNQLLYFLWSETNLKATDIGLALLGFMLFHLFVQRKRKGLPRWPLLGMLPSLLLHLNEIHDWGTKVLIDSGGTFYFKGSFMTGLTAVVTANPPNLEQVLRLKFNNYPKGRYFRSRVHDFLGDVIFNADGDLWKAQRKTANIEFNSRSFRAKMAKSVAELVQNRLMPLLEETARSGNPIDLQDVFLRFTFDNVCMITLGVNPGGLAGGGAEAREFARAFENATEITMLRFLTPPIVWRLMRFFQLGHERKLYSSLATINRFVDKIIGSRTGNSGTDLLSAFMKVKTESGDRLYTDEKLREIMVNFILAGRDTSSVALSWFFWLLLSNPRVEEQILAEIRSLKPMHYLHAALSESLRLFPSVPFDFKEVDSDDRLPDGSYLRKGFWLIYSIYSMGRMESIWGKDCMEFRPERWLDTGGKFVAVSAYKYPVFNGGPRICLGKDFAYYQMKWIAATTIWGFRMKMVAGHVVEPKLGLTLYMKNGLLVTLKPRDPLGL